MREVLREELLMQKKCQMQNPEQNITYIPEEHTGVRLFYHGVERTSSRMLTKDVWNKST